MTEARKAHLLLLFALFVLWTFCNPFFAVDRGSLIYIGRALADLDPSGIGRDNMFRYDGQSGFTIFTPIFRWLTEVSGISAATYLIAAASVIFSFVGAVVFASSIAKDRTRYLVIAFAAALPAYYGGYKFFSYAETAATPRPFAETFVLCGLAALINRRYALSIFFMVCATLLHPIMALPGIAVLACWFVTVEHKWALIVLGVAAAAAMSALAYAPSLGQTLSAVDPEWRSILVDRNPHLFPSLWLTGWIGRTATRTATLLIAANLVPVAVRKLFLLIIAVGYAGLAASYFLGERLSILVVLEAQTWRMMWLIFASGAAAAAICVVALWRRGGVARIVLALLALAWAWADYDGPAVLLAATAAIVHYTVDPKEYPLRREAVWGVLAAVAVLFITGLVYTQIYMLGILQAAPAGMAMEARRSLSLQYDYTPLAVLAGIFAITGLPRRGMPIYVTATGIAAVAVFMSWDQRSLANRYFDSGKGTPDLEAMISGKPGEVYWIDGLRENWWWLHRPNWVSSIQGAGIVFSRELALLYKERAQRARDAGLADESLLTPFGQTSAIPTAVTVENLNQFCAFPDAPVWIVVPLFATTKLDPEITSTQWDAPVEQLDVSMQHGQYHWRRVSRYAVMSCGKQKDTSS